MVEVNCIDTYRTGDNNIAVGSDALECNTTGTADNNTAVGYALACFTTTGKQHCGWS